MLCSRLFSWSDGSLPGFFPAWSGVSGVNSGRRCVGGTSISTPVVSEWSNMVDAVRKSRRKIDTEPAKTEAVFFFVAGGMQHCFGRRLGFDSGYGTLRMEGGSWTDTGVEDFAPLVCYSDRSASPPITDFWQPAALQGLLVRLRRAPAMGKLLMAVAPCSKQMDVSSFSRLSSLLQYRRQGSNSRQVSWTMCGYRQVRLASGSGHGSGARLQ